MASGHNNAITGKISRSFYIVGRQDPSVIATLGARGAVFLQVGSGPLSVFRKQDDGVTTNWLPIIGGGGAVLRGDIYNSPAGILIGDVVYADPLGSNLIDLAVGNSATTAHAIGFVIDKPTATTARVLNYGRTPALFAGLTVNKSVWLSPTIPGMITQTVPGAGTWLMHLGVATSPNEISIMLGTMPTDRA